MKTMILMMVIFATTLGISTNGMAQDAKKGSETTALYLSCNMDCHSCENKLTEHLKFEKGVKDLKCDFESNTIYVLYKTGSNSTENLIKSVEKKGYKAEVISQEAYDAKQKEGVAVDEHAH